MSRERAVTESGTPQLEVFRGDNLGSDEVLSFAKRAGVPSSLLSRNAIPAFIDYTLAEYENFTTASQRIAVHSLAALALLKWSQEKKSASSTSGETGEKSQTNKACQILKRACQDSNATVVIHLNKTLGTLLCQLVRKRDECAPKILRVLLQSLTHNFTNIQCRSAAEKCLVDALQSYPRIPVKAAVHVFVKELLQLSQVSRTDFSLLITLVNNPKLRGDDCLRICNALPHLLRSTALDDLLLFQKLLEAVLSFLMVASDGKAAVKALQRSVSTWTAELDANKGLAPGPVKQVLEQIAAALSGGFHSRGSCQQDCESKAAPSALRQIQRKRTKSVEELAVNRSCERSKKRQKADQTAASPSSRREVSSRGVEAVHDEKERRQARGPTFLAQQSDSQLKRSSEDDPKTRPASSDRQEKREITHKEVAASKRKGRAMCRSLQDEKTSCPIQIDDGRADASKISTVSVNAQKDDAKRKRTVEERTVSSTTADKKQPKRVSFVLPPLETRAKRVRSRSTAACLPRAIENSDTVEEINRERDSVSVALREGLFPPLQPKIAFTLCNDCSAEKENTENSLTDERKLSKGQDVRTSDAREEGRNSIQQAPRIPKLSVPHSAQPSKERGGRDSYISFSERDRRIYIDNILGPSGHNETWEIVSSAR